MCTYFDTNFKNFLGTVAPKGSGDGASSDISPRYVVASRLAPGFRPLTLPYHFADAVAAHRVKLND